MESNMALDEPANEILSKKNFVKGLMSDKDKLEKEIKELYGLLTTCGTNMTEDLVDEGGFPRSDLDVYKVRHARHDIICKENDLRTLIEKIHHEIEELHQISRKANPEPEEERMETDRAESGRNGDIPFARVDALTTASPAANAGLQDGDLVVQLGSLRHANFKNMQQVGDIVKNSKDRSIAVTILRDEHLLRISLTPKQWTGPGLLGCQISKLK